MEDYLAAVIAASPQRARELAERLGRDILKEWYAGQRCCIDHGLYLTSPTSQVPVCRLTVAGLEPPANWRTTGY
jgi:hypothetical protein